MCRAGLGSGRGIARGIGCEGVAATIVDCGATDEDTAGGTAGGVQPGGGWKALFGSLGRTAAATTTASEGAAEGVEGGNGAAVRIMVAVAGVGSTGAGRGGTVVATAGAGAGGGVTGCGTGSAGGAAATLREDIGDAFAIASAPLLDASSRARAAAASRASAACLEDSLAAASNWAFCPPRPATSDPICGPVRVSSTGA